MLVNVFSDSKLQLPGRKLSLVLTQQIPKFVKKATDILLIFQLHICVRFYFLHIFQAKKHNAKN